ncbi:MAG: DNA repair protein RecO [Planctomycetota bacterium]
MSGESTLAVIVRLVPFSETSFVVTLLTRDFGRLSAIAKGARRPKGPFEGSLDLLAVCRVVVIRKTSDRLDLLTEAKLHRRFRAAEKSLPRLYAGYAVAELLRILIDDDEPHTEVYDLTIATLQQIDSDGPVQATLLCFQAQLLRLLGHQPSLDRCAECGEVFSEHTSAGPAAGNQAIARVSSVMPFSLVSGGLVCSQCRSSSQQNVGLPHATVEILRNLFDPLPSFASHLAFESHIATVRRQMGSVNSTHYHALRGVIDRWIASIAGQVPKMQTLVSQRLMEESR